VLISGESGTGKELVAQTIHQLSARASATYVPINCVAIPDMLLESEMFGHEKGAFTGAVERRAGCFEIADHGTLFLDEIAEMTPPTQVKLLRVLQERTFRRLGGRNEQAVDIRIIAATNVDPQTAAREGKLREDLYYRLNVFEIKLPPLRDRKSDLPLLIEHFVNEYNARHDRSIAALEPRAMELLCAYSWPGNVRELRNVIERATIVAGGHFITTDDLPQLVDITRAREADSGSVRGLAPGLTVAEAEQQLIEVTLQHTRGNKTRAAELLGISLKTLHNKLNRAKDDENAISA
jgi:transcriptional regulator with PAS, ATPase and Fis domain